LKKLFLILFLLISFNFKAFSDINEKITNLVILDKSSSTKHELSISGNQIYRSLKFTIISCKFHNFEKYVDQIALIKITNLLDNSEFTGWFFSKTEELNEFSDKIYEVRLVNCAN
tara:strand:- start:352 stop:696 length:345 start_codon:yes stop_codon:yes gene_type:complete